MNVGPRSLEATASPNPPAATLPTTVLQLLPCCKSSPPGCPFPPLLPVWMNVCSLSPQLLDFHTVLFSVGSGCFLFLNLLLSLCWLCEEARCVYLCLHIGQKSLCLFLEFWSALLFGSNFFVWVHQLYFKGQRLRYLPGWGNPLCPMWRYMWGRSQRQSNAACLALALFQSLPSLPTSGLCPFRCWFPGKWASVHSRILWAHLQRTPLWDWEFLSLLQPPLVFTARDSKALVSCAGTLGVAVCLTSQLLLLAFP